MKRIIFILILLFFSFGCVKQEVGDSSTVDSIFEDYSDGDSYVDDSPRRVDGSDDYKEREEPQDTQTGEVDEEELDLPSCGDKMDFYTVSPLNSEDFTKIKPLGNLHPSGHTFPTDHIYFDITESTPNEGRKDLVTVYSPGDIVITSVSSSEHTSATPVYTDYFLDYWVCEDVKGRLGHVSSISDKITSELGEPSSACNEYETGGNHYKLCEYNTRIEISAGEIIGTAGGNPHQCCLDMWTIDYRMEPLEYANPDRWVEGKKADAFYIACPADYFVYDIKEELYDKFGYWIVKRTIEPICGSIDQDILGTAQGIWYANGAPLFSGEDPHLALVHDNVDPTIGAFSIGRSIEGIDSAVYQFTPRDSGLVDRKFSQVIPGEVYCYEAKTIYEETPGFTIILELPTETSLRIEKRNETSCGSGGWEFSNPTLFDR